jgi:tetratricopeptide (TPR) repeat protein
MKTIATLLRCLPLVLSCFLAGSALAQTFKDPLLESLYVAERNDELRRQSATRLAARPDDAQAVLGLALAALAHDDAPARQEALQRARACIELQPRAAACHFALGGVLGVQAMSEGMFKAARSAGTVREALATAHEIEPAWYPARSALTEFYAGAPGIMGGSSAKAAELARSAPRPEQSRLLEARIAMFDKRFDDAVSAFMALPAVMEPATADDARTWAAQCVLAMVNAGQAAKAQSLAEKMAREHTEQAAPAYALGRLRGEAGEHEASLRLFEQATALKGADAWPLGWRIGIAQQALGRKEAARAAFARFISAGKGSKNALDDAKKRLEQLGT